MGTDHSENLNNKIPVSSTVEVSFINRCGMDNCVVERPTSEPIDGQLHGGKANLGAN